MKAMTRVGAMLTTAAVMLACVLVAPWAMPASAAPEEETPATAPVAEEQTEFLQEELPVLTVEDEMESETEAPVTTPDEEVWVETMPVEEELTVVTTCGENQPELASAESLSTAAAHSCLITITNTRNYYKHSSSGGCYLVTEQTGRCINEDGNCPHGNRTTTLTSEKSVSHSISKKMTSQNHLKADPAQHTVTYQETCKNTGTVLRTWTEKAGCTVNNCWIHTQSVEPETEES